MLYSLECALCNSRYDELTLAVTAGNSVYLYDVPGFSVMNCRHFFIVAVESYIKDFRWRPHEDDYLVLSNGKVSKHKVPRLVRGGFKDVHVTVVEHGALAISWSPDGNQFAFATSDGHVHIVAEDLSLTFKILLPCLPGLHKDVTAEVDTVHWVRRESIMLSYVTIRGEEVGCPLVIIHCSSTLAEEDAERTLIAFSNVFACTEAAIPNNSGPYMNVEYLPRWNLALASNRRSVDYHIEPVGWGLKLGLVLDEDGYGAGIGLEDDGEPVAWGLMCGPASLELDEEGYGPRIGLEDDGENDIFVVELGVDQTTEQTTVLVSMTSRGKLTLQWFARATREMAGDVRSALSGLPLDPGLAHDGFPLGQDPVFFIPQGPVCPRRTPDWI